MFNATHLWEIYELKRTVQSWKDETIQEQRNHAYAVLFVRVTLSRDTRDYL